ncbi:MAG: insulinase family protein, partial [Deltaproteobacteria bacterium]|nr:insulinase family protein [Deltaproteobacteria bacterium]
RAVIVVAGGFDENSVLDMINRAYSHIPTGAEQAPLPSPEPPPAGENRQTITHPKISSDMLYAATHSPGIRHEDTPALLALSWFLSAGMSSPLHQRLVSCGLATHAEASLLDVDWTMSSPSLFLMEAAMQQGVPAEKAEQVIQELALEIVDKGISQEDHQRTINQMKLAHFSSLRNNMGLARYVGRHWVACQDPLFGDTLEAAAERVTPDQMVDVLQRYWINSPKIIVTQRPGEKSEAA